MPRAKEGGAVSLRKAKCLRLPKKLHSKNYYCFPMSPKGVKPKTKVNQNQPESTIVFGWSWKPREKSYENGKEMVVRMGRVWWLLDGLHEKDVMFCSCEFC